MVDETEAGETTLWLSVRLIDPGGVRDRLARDKERQNQEAED